MTTTFENSPLLAWLDTYFQNSWTLGLVTIGSGALLGVGVVTTMMATPGFDDGEEYFQTLSIMTNFLLLQGSGWMIFLSIKLGRWIESDLLELGDDLVNVSELNRELTPTKSSLRLVIGTFILFYWLMFLTADWFLQGGDFLGPFQGAENLARSLLFYGVTLSTLGMAAGTFLLVWFLQCRTLTTLAREIEIDLLQLPRYQCMSALFVRAVVFGLLSLAIIPVFMDQLGELRTPVTVVSVIFVFALLFLIGGYLYPLVVLHDRIKLTINKELATINQKLMSSPGAGFQMRVADRGSLLTQQMYLESRWAWPIGEYIQKLVFFGLIPPLTWVMAAVVENMLY